MADLIPFDDRDGHIWMNGKVIAWRDAKIAYKTELSKALYFVSELRKATTWASNS